MFGTTAMSCVCSRFSTVQGHKLYRSVSSGVIPQRFKEQWKNSVHVAARNAKKRERMVDVVFLQQYGEVGFPGEVVRVRPGYVVLT